jgi:hypothetical protein
VQGVQGLPGPPGPGTREQQITIFTNLSDATGNFGQCTAQWLSVTSAGCNPDGSLIDPSSELITAVTIDRDRYDLAAQFYFDVTLGVSSPAPRQLCVRLYDVTAAMPVAGSNFCETTYGTHVDRVPITLASGSHQYIVQQNAVNYQGVVLAARIIAQL